MKISLSLLAQIIFLLLLAKVSFSQEVEVQLAGSDTSDAFVVKNADTKVLLKADGDRNFGINTDHPDGIEIFGREGTYGVKPGSVSIIGGSGYPYDGGSIKIVGGDGDSGGNININSGNGSQGNSGNINIITGDGLSSGDINIKTGPSNSNGGSIALTASPYGNIILTTQDYGDIELSSSNNILLKTQSSESDIGDISLETGYSYGGYNNIWLTVGDDSHGVEGNSRGIILSPNGGVVEVVGSGTYTGTWTQASDERYKSNIKSLPEIMKKVKLLQPVEYEWNKDRYPEENFPDGKQVGLIAQEVEKIFPEIVATDKDGYKSIDYSKISVLLLQAMKEQQNEIEKQSDEIRKMKSELEELKAMILQESNQFSSNEN